jgi:hypothetical protein
MIYYAGIGSRETPPNVCKEMFRLAQDLADRRWVLRSGGADGADSAFEEGCDENRGYKEIFLPWYGFNGRFEVETTPGRLVTVPPLTNSLRRIANSVQHLDRMSQGVQKLKCRNVCQILGNIPGKSPPTNVVICYQDPKKKTGGTLFAMNLTLKCHPIIPVFNMAVLKTDAIRKMLDKFDA